MIYSVTNYNVTQTTRHLMKLEHVYVSFVLPLNYPEQFLQLQYLRDRGKAKTDFILLDTSFCQRASRAKTHGWRGGRE